MLSSQFVPTVLPIVLFLRMVIGAWCEHSWGKRTRDIERSRLCLAQRRKRGIRDIPSAGEGPIVYTRLGMHGFWRLMVDI
ncbi:hypothetical protein F4781DRAFT_399356 [Annulohypoxylon bovei var. microspora]|nr:hypothetical protein F4781DRAFT_399356 [Annulohypoxylon bovei var. microspora]